MGDMTVTVKLFATLREERPPIQRLTLPEGLRVRELVRRLGIAEKEVSLILVNHCHRDWDHLLVEGETLALFPPVGGG